MEPVQPFIGRQRRESLNPFQAPAVPLPYPTAGANPKEDIMRDEIFDRDYQAGRNDLHDGIDRLVAGTMNTFRLLASIQFSAPWRGHARSEGGRSGVA